MFSGGASATMAAPAAPAAAAAAAKKSSFVEVTNDPPKGLAGTHNPKALPFFWPYMLRFPGLPWPAHQLLPGYEMITKSMFSGGASATMAAPAAPAAAAAAAKK